MLYILDQLGEENIDYYYDNHCSRLKNAERKKQEIENNDPEWKKQANYNWSLR